MASRMTEIPKSLPPDASCFCRPASADSDSNVRSASLLPYTGLRGPTLCPFCGCVAPKLLRVAWPNSKPDQPPLPCAYALPLRPVPTSTHAGWEGRPEWRTIHDGLRPAQCDLPEPGERCQGWQHHGSRACSTRFRDTELLPALAPLAQAVLRSQSGPHAAAWLGTVPSEAGTTIPPDRMLIALRRRLRLPLPVAQGRCGAKPLERAWIRVVREALGPEGQVVPQQWLVRTPAPGVGAVTLVSPLARDGRPQPSSTTQGWCCPGRRRTPQARCLP